MLLNAWDCFHNKWNILINVSNICTADDMYKYVFVGVKIISFRVKYREDIRSEKSFVGN